MPKILIWTGAFSHAECAGIVALEVGGWLTLCLNMGLSVPSLSSFVDESKVMQMAILHPHNIEARH